MCFTSLNSFHFENVIWGVNKIQHFNQYVIANIKNSMLKKKQITTFPIRGRSFNFARLFLICETAPQHFNVFATSSSLSIYSSSVKGNDLCSMYFHITFKARRFRPMNSYIRVQKDMLIIDSLNMKELIPPTASQTKRTDRQKAI